MKKLTYLAKTLTFAVAAVALLGPTTARSDVINVARNAAAYSNRPIYGGWSMSQLIDGNLTNQVHADTNPAAGFAYTVDLGKAYSVNQLKIWPRLDCCPERLTNFRVSVHADDGAGNLGAEVWGTSLYTDGISHPDTTPGTVVLIDPPSPQTGRWVQILSLADPVPSYALQINDFAVFATVPPEEVNRALNAPATANQPLYSDAPAGLLVDGYRSPQVHGLDVIDPGFAYDINLGAPINLNKIVIWARQDTCCPERLSNYRVSVHQNDNGSPGSQVWKADLHTDGSNPGSSAGAKDELTAALDPAGTFTGQWIRILSLDDPVPQFALQIGEIEAYGLSAGPVTLSLAAHPQDTAAGAGTTATFNVTALAAGGDSSLITYQWEKGGVAIPGANGASYTTPLLGASDDGKKFRCVVGYPGLPSQTSNEATLTLNIAYHAAVTANQPTYASWPMAWLVNGDRQGSLHLADNLSPGAAYEVNLGSPYALNRIVLWARQDGCCPERLTNFQVSVHQDNQGQIGQSVWQADFFTDGTFPPSAQGSTVEITPNLDPAGQFAGQWLRILSLEDPVQNYALQINELEAFGTSLGGVNLVISQQPLSAAAGVGVPATLTVVAAAPGGEPSQITYQWQKEGVNIDGATQASYVTPPLAASDDNKKFRCIVGYPGLPSQTTNEAAVRVNLAFLAVASANAPLYGGWSPSSLTDGIRGNLVHGDTGLPVGFAYEANLGIEVNISAITVFARQDAFGPERLTNYRLSVHKDANGQIGDPVWSADLHTDGSNPGAGPGSKDEAVASLDPAGTFKGQWIRIQSLEDPVQNYALQIAEVEVYGAYASPNAVTSFVTHPADAVTAPGRSVRFSAVGKVINGNPAQLTYQWQQNGTNIPGALSSVYNTPPLSGPDANSTFRCVLSHPGSPDVLSSPATVTFDYNYAKGQPVSSNRPLYGGYQVAQLVNGNRGDTIHGNTAIAPGFAYEVNFGLDIDVESISLYPRQDGCCPERFTNLRVLLLADNAGQPGAELWHADLFTDGTFPPSADGSVVPVTQNLGVGTFSGARWIRILSLDSPPGDYALQMGEIEVYGNLPGAAPALVIGNVVYDPATHIIQLTWNSQPNAVYALEGSATMSTAGWLEINDNIPSGGPTTTYSYDVNTYPPGGATPPLLFLRITKP